MRHVALLVLSAALVVAACDKPADPAPKANAPAETAATKPAATPTPAPTPTPAAKTPPKSEYKPSELWTEANALSRFERMEKYVKGVTVVGTIKAIKDDPVGEYGIELDAENNHVVELRFGDFGKAAKDKKLKAGAAVSASDCQVTNPTGDRMALVQCVLK